MSDDTTLLQLQEARRALAQCVGERDRSRGEARRLRAQLRALRAELSLVRPVEQEELLAAQAAQVQAQLDLAESKHAQAQAEALQAEQARQALDIQGQLAQRDREAEFSLMRVMELREQLLQAKSSLGMQEAALHLLRSELESERKQAAALPPEERHLERDLREIERQDRQREGEPRRGPPAADLGVISPEPPVEQEREVPPSQRSQRTAWPEFDLPEGSIWEFTGMAEPRWFYQICSELAALKVGVDLQIGHFESGEDRVVVVMGAEGTARTFLEAFWQDEVRLMSSLGLPLIRIQPSTWCTTHWGRDGKPALPKRFEWWRDRIVRGELLAMHQEE